MNILYVLALGFTVSLDSFAAGLSYGLKSITISFRPLLVVGAVTATCTGLSLFVSNLAGQAIGTHFATAGGALLLIALGVFNLLQEYLVAPSSESDKKISFSVGKMVVTIMSKPETADFDQSLSISCSEAIYLGLALGIDNIVAVFATGLIGILPLYTPILMGIIQMLFLSAGCYASSRITSEDLKRRFPYLPGTILIFIGLLRIK